MAEPSERHSPGPVHRQLKQLNDSQLTNALPLTIGGGIGVGCSWAVMLPGTYTAFQALFSNGLGWSIAILCFVGGAIGGISQALFVRFGVRRNKQMPNFLATRMTGVAMGIAVMVGTGIATGVYRGISESLNWSIHSIATAVIATFTMCLLGGFVGIGVHMLVRIAGSHLKLR